MAKRISPRSTVIDFDDLGFDAMKLCSNDNDERTTKRAKTVETTQGDEEYSFGERQIGFRIVAGDARHCEKYHESRGYSEAAMEKSLFDCQLGTRPRLKTILRLTSEWDEEKAREKNEDAIILDNKHDIALLRILKIVGIGSKKREEKPRSLYCGDIAATWDAQTATGTFKIRLFLQSKCTRMSDRNDDHALLLGCWFNIFPLKLQSISGTMKASIRDYDLPSSKVKDAFAASVSSHNEKADEFISSLTLTSSWSNRESGGYTSNDISLKGVLESFYREHFPYRYFDRPKIEDSDDWNKVSSHKVSKPSDHDFVLSYSDQRFAAMCLFDRVSHSRKYKQEYRTQEMLAHLEDLGHEPELTCEGLTVELLEFQKQSLRWAMERETTPGGMQSYFWVKVPIEDCTLYFNPILGRFRKDKPKAVRGGIIAEEMGLGKTIISLALILKHPAPALPISGSDICCLENVPTNVADGNESNVLKWDVDLYSQTSTDNKLRGSVLSRGTLVICPVSLVGQWIEEAKSKLSNPGLLYVYHGGKRIRYAQKLAKNAIVVTTYQVLASDDTYHRNKSPNPDEYCPPLEQVRWWRVICDEGHSLRQSSTQKNRSLLKLVADNKWMVTGTPVSTSMHDLKSQLKLIGVEDFDGMLQRPAEYGERGIVLQSPGNLRFLLRNIMIRHTQQQLYRGTTTSLMSLPPKTERVIEVTLSDAERKKYDVLETAARDFYVQFKADHSRALSKNYLLLSQKLAPLRVACAGGHPPVKPEAENGEEDDSDGDAQPIQKKEVTLSNFCFTSKLKALIEELKQARDTDPTSKSLVFTQFNMTLDWLKKELPNHGFHFRTLSGSMTMKQRAKALHDFQADPPTTIFLLSMRAGNFGINLTQANRVFLMEPSFNPALEKQAIGRVHRLGQKRNVEIIRLFVKDSIEKRICKLLETKYGVECHGSKKCSENDEQESDSDKVKSNVLVELVGNLATERPKNAMVASEFDLLFGVESETEKFDCTTLPGVAAPDTAISAEFL